MLGLVLSATLVVGTASAASVVSHGEHSGHTSATRPAPSTAPSRATDVRASAVRRDVRQQPVAPLRHQLTGDLLVISRHALPRATVSGVRHLPGVTAATVVDAGTASVRGHRASLLGVDPSAFRAYTPKLTAISDPLWRSIASGDLTVSFDMGHETRLPLGGDVGVITKTHRIPIRIGAFATVGMGSVDGVVSRDRAAELGFARGNGMVLSAPKADPVALRDAIRAIVPADTDVQLLRRVIVVRDAGEFLTRQQIRTVLTAAATKIGKPYVWGATGPDAFDCSGLTGWAYAKAGVSLPRTTYQQWYAGPHVPLSDARPGDLLFWNYDPTAPKLPDHVALYAGDGMMLVAPHTGDVVSYRPVPTAHLLGVVRIDPKAAAQVGGPRFLVG
jgi:hypothetical protein